MRVSRWGGGLPQYSVGHLDRVASIRAGIAAEPGLAICGAAYDGVGIPACIATARLAANQVLAYLDSQGSGPGTPGPPGGSEVPVIELDQDGSVFVLRMRGGENRFSLELARRGQRGARPGSRRSRGRARW